MFVVYAAAAAALVMYPTVRAAAPSAQALLWHFSQLLLPFLLSPALLPTLPSAALIGVLRQSQTLSWQLPCARNAFGQFQTDLCRLQQQWRHWLLPAALIVAVHCLIDFPLALPQLRWLGSWRGRLGAI